MSLLSETTNRVALGASDLQPQLVNIRRHIHSHPELSMQERETARFIAQKLSDWGITYSGGWAGNGLVGIIDGNGPGPCVALRADMDALPIDEKNDVPYKSKNIGVMHACGHDVHSTCLLGAAKILNDTKTSWSGSVKLIFQPSEEKLPGGASIMIDEGVLENPRPDCIVALHVYPALETGLVGFRKGMYMASCDEMYITVKGKGGHAAIPAGINNPLYIASDLLLRYKKLADELAKAEVPTVLQFGKITGLGATNVVPDTVRVEGTFRTMEETWRKKVNEQIRQVSADVAIEHGCEIDCHLERGYPFLKNDANLTEQCKESAERYLGKQNVKELDIRMASEDFAYYSQVVPACFFRLGTGNVKRGITSPVHTATFDIDEDALQIGAGLLAHMAIDLLNEKLKTKN